MIADSRQTIHKIINFLFTPFTGIERKTAIQFQSALLDRGLDFSAIQSAENQLMVVREKPARLEIQVAMPGPSMGQLLIAGPHGAHHGEMFEREAEAVVDAFNDIWYDAKRQLVGCEVLVRDLFESSHEHAFQELWTHRLQQREDSLGILGRPVLGGGLRLVMPPLPGEAMPCQIEVKIESFLQDTKKIYVETQFTWPAPAGVGAPMNPPERFKAIEAYIENNVITFIEGNNHEN